MHAEQVSSYNPEEKKDLIKNYKGELYNQSQFSITHYTKEFDRDWQQFSEKSFKKFYTDWNVFSIPP